MSACSSEFGVQQVTVATDTSTAFDVGPHSKGNVQFPATLDASAFTLLVSNDGTTYNVMRNAAGSIVGATPCEVLAMIPLPSEVFNYRFAKIKFADAELAARTLTVFLKF